MGYAGSTTITADGISSPSLAAPPAFELPWEHLQRAALQDDPLAYAAASAVAARSCLMEGDLDEALWHAQRGWRFLDLPLDCAHSLNLRCELADLTLALANQPVIDEAQARRWRDDTRDAAFDIVRRCRAVVERTTTLLRVADLLDALGDQIDAENVRRQVLQS